MGFFIPYLSQNFLIGCLLLQIIYTPFDSSLFDLKANLKQIWELNFSPLKFTLNVEYSLKYIAISVIFTRTLTLYPLLACSIFLLRPLIFEDRVNLMLPWLLIGVLRYLVAPLMGQIPVICVCTAHKFTKSICFESLFVTFIEYGPSIYVWFSVFNFYKQLVSSNKEIDELKRKQSQYNFETLQRRRKSRSIYFDEAGYNALQQLKEDDRQLISASALENALNHFTFGNQLVGNSRSLDSLLKKIVTEAGKREIMTLTETETDTEIKEEELEKENKKLSVQARVVKLLELGEEFNNNNKNAKKATGATTNLQVTSEITPLPPERPKVKRCSSDESCVSGGPTSIQISERELRTIAMNNEQETGEEQDSQCNEEKTENEKSMNSSTKNEKEATTAALMKHSRIPVLKRRLIQQQQYAKSFERDKDKDKVRDSSPSFPKKNPFISLTVNSPSSYNNNNYRNDKDKNEEEIMANTGKNEEPAGDNDEQVKEVDDEEGGEEVVEGEIYTSPSSSAETTRLKKLENLENQQAAEEMSVDYELISKTQDVVNVVNSSSSVSELIDPLKWKQVVIREGNKEIIVNKLRHKVEFSTHIHNSSHTYTSKSNQNNNNNVIYEEDMSDGMLMQNQQNYVGAAPGILNPSNDANIGLRVSSKNFQDDGFTVAFLTQHHRAKRVIEARKAFISSSLPPSAAHKH